ncbi:riboflavin synthase [Lactarius deliciosus]|nr:riboflavin synthase [Lactarius deliciosus]
MFTGLIEHLGTVSAIVLDSGGCTLTISDASPILGDCHVGDSIAVNGACLTVTKFNALEQGGWFQVWLANETLERTDLGERIVGDQLNLERAMAPHVRFGGHFVQGYVTIDGTSLTLTEVDDVKRTFGIMLIQHTQEKITLSKKKIGAKVNIEVDMVGKYVEKSVSAALSGSGSGEAHAHWKELIERVVEEVTAKVNLSNVITFHAVPPSRPQSPFKVKPPHPPSSIISEPAFRPKARRSSSSPGAASSTVKSIPRPSSPFKPTAHSSTRSAVDAHTSRPKALRAAHGLSRQRSLTSTAEASSARARRGSGSFQPTPSTSTSPHLPLDGPSSTATSPPIRVKAKVSSFAKSNGASVPPIPLNSLHPSSPPYATTRPIETRPRAPSVIDFGGFVSTPSSPTTSVAPLAIHPITTATSAANPHRYVSRFNQTMTRFQSLSPPGTRDLDNDLYFRVAPKVDPAAIPLPPQSPPVSTLSFSSQSSQNTQGSCASGSTAPTPSSHFLGTALISGEQSSPTLSSGSVLEASDEASYSNPSRRSLGSPTAYPEDSDRKIRAEAKSNRKIEDLEITNRSLLAINATLEATKHRQANEIRDLRRKLRESRLMLPPHTFRAIKSSLGPEDVADDEDTDDSEDDGDDDNDGDGNEHDAAFSRVKGILGDLLESGRRALRAEPKDFEGQSRGVKVLSAEESDEETGPQRRRLPPLRIAVSEDLAKGGDRGEAVTGSDEHGTGVLPPITVTFS